MSESTGMALTASEPLPQLTRLDLLIAHNMAVPWQHLSGLLELVLRRGLEASLLEGATHLTSLNSLVLDCSANFVPPPGAWLGSVTSLEVVEIANGEVG